MFSVSFLVRLDSSVMRLGLRWYPWRAAFVPGLRHVFHHPYDIFLFSELAQISRSSSARFFAG